MADCLDGGCHGGVGEGRGRDAVDVHALQMLVQWGFEECKGVGLQGRFGDGHRGQYVRGRAQPRFFDEKQVSVEAIEGRIGRVDQLAVAKKVYEGERGHLVDLATLGGDAVPRKDAPQFPAYVIAWGARRTSA